MSRATSAEPTSNGQTGSRRFSILAGRDINRETYVEEWAEAGLTVADSPYDPRPSLRIVNGQVMEMDGKERAEFDALDRFIADHALDLTAAAKAMATPSDQIARMLVDINVPQPAIRRLAGGCTPAKLCEIVRHMNVLEMMMGLGKMRVRKTPANQAHVTNWRENPPCWPRTRPKPHCAALPKSRRRYGSRAPRPSTRSPFSSARRPGAAACSPSARWRRRSGCVWASRG